MPTTGHSRTDFSASLAPSMPLTAKQQAQVAKAPAGQKANLKAMFERQNKEAGKRAATRAKARPARSVRLVPAPKGLIAAFDGFDKYHMPVDEVTAPYTTTNFITVMNFASSTTMDQVIVVSPRLASSLTDYIAVQYDANETIGGTIPYLGLARCPVLGQPAVSGDWQSFSMRGRLHNLSVRLGCLGTNTAMYPIGAVYLGTVPTLENLEMRLSSGTSSTGSQTIKTAWAEDSIAVGYIRPVSAASLIEQPVTLHAAVAETVAYKTWSDFQVPPNTVDLGSLPFTNALEPIVLYIPRVGAGSTVVDYRLEIGQQWCTRHPHDVMLRATQKQHVPTPPNEWHKALSAVKNIGEAVLSRAANVAMDALADRARTALAIAPAEAI